MANFAGDFSSAYTCIGSLFNTSTGASTDANLAGGSADLSPDVANVLSAFLIVGNAAGTTPTLNVKVQESTTGTGSWSDVADAAFTQVTTSNQIQVLPIKPKYRYLRTTGTVGGTNPIFETTTIFLAPTTTAPANAGGFSTASSASV